MSRGSRAKSDSNRLSVVGGHSRPASESPELAHLREQLISTGAPPEIVAVLTDSTDLSDALQRLESAGLAPSPDESLAVMLDEWSPLLRRGTDPLSAELSGAEFLAMLRSTAPDEVVADVLPGLLAAAEETGRPEALAMLRVLAVLGDAPIRHAAAAGADRLVASGLKDRPWVSGLGRPTVGPAFGYADPLGFQESVIATFRYGRRSHALAVLIDHGLGGGVKDCFFGDDPAQLRSEYQRVVQRNGLDLHDITTTEAAGILERALAAKPCPVEPDQIEDVATHLDLLRQRTALLRSAPEPRPDRPSGKVHTLKITLARSKPPIWRRVEVASGTTLDELHVIIQAAFGWEDCHLWVFSTNHGDFGVRDLELGFSDAAATTLSRVARRVGAKLRYTYDFGDDWEHSLVVEAIADAEPGVSYPRCLTGRRAGPPEDCGGIWSYADLVEILRDASHPEHAERLEWLGLESGDQFDPAAFDLDAVNAVLSARIRVTDIPNPQ